MKQQITFTVKERKSVIFNVKELQPTKQHPLQEEEIVKQPETAVKSSKNSTKTSKTRISNISYDPLSAAGNDPLSSAAAANDTLDIIGDKKSAEIEDLYLEDWRNFRKEIIANFSSKTNLPAISIIPGENSPRHVTVQEFISDLESKQSEMVTAWTKEDRVESLKIIIQCLKSLSSNSAIEFYPAKVFLVLDVLSIFVDLVEKRLQAMDEETAHEVAKNWYYKIFSIR